MHLPRLRSRSTLPVRDCSVGSISGRIIDSRNARVAPEVGFLRDAQPSFLSRQLQHSQGIGYQHRMFELLVFDVRDEAESPHVGQEHGPKFRAAFPALAWSIPERVRWAASTSPSPTLSLPTRSRLPRLLLNPLPNRRSPSLATPF